MVVVGLQFVMGERLPVPVAKGGERRGVHRLPIVHADVRMHHSACDSKGANNGFRP